MLNQALVKSKYDAWVDWESIPLTADWWEEIKAGIEAADTFIFVISPDSVASKVCGQEIDHAVANHKRLVPVVRREERRILLLRSLLGIMSAAFWQRRGRGSTPTGCGSGGRLPKLPHWRRPLMRSF